MDFSALVSQLESSGCNVTEYALLSALTTFRIGGPARVFADVPLTAIPAIGGILQQCKEHGIPVVWLGKGSNVLCADEGLSALVLRMEPETAVNVEDGRLLSCSAGVSLTTLCRTAQKNGLTGLEFAFGIPGSVGGAVYMNAGAYGGEMADVIAGAEALDAAGHAVTLSADDLALGYRHSALMERGEDDRLLLTAVILRLSPGNAGEVAERMAELLGRRKEKQPLDYPSAGSFFKRPEGYFAGALIEGAGLKGYRVGGAAISDKHAGFVINCGGATAADVRQLCRDVQERILQKDGVRLEPEVRFIGEF